MNPSLTVNRVQFAQGLKMLGKFLKPARVGQALLSFEDGALKVELGGLAASTAASGDWPGQARVDGRFVLAIGRGLPETETVTITVEEDRLRVSMFTTRCWWQAAEAPPIRLPVNPSFTAILALPLQYGEEEIERSGLTKVVDAALERKSRLVERAAEILGPLGIDVDDLRDIVDRCILRSEGA